MVQQADQVAGAPKAGEAREVALEAVLAAGEIVRAGFGKVQRLRFKGEVDLVTEVDERAERTIVEIIRRRFPQHTILAEEGSAGGQDARFRWIVDPLDGTTNYAHALPLFCTSIAYEEDGAIVLGAIYDPIRDELFLAQRGRGATLNGRRLAVSTNDVLLTCLTATGFPYDRAQLPRALRSFSALSAATQGVRRLGSAALDCAYVASGRLDAYWEHFVNPWDVAAGWLMVVEAGGQVTSTAGAPFEFEPGDILASNGLIHDVFLSALANAQQP
jgi:myo-inositol-1(or 4)-monophosphatase